MAEISSIKLPNNVTYDLADNTARSGLSTISITVPASGWIEDITNHCYYNDVTVSGVSASDNYEIVGFTPSSTVSDNATIKEQLGYITYGVTGANTIKFIVIEQVPTVDLPIVLRKVL